RRQRLDEFPTRSLTEFEQPLADRGVIDGLRQIVRLGRGVKIVKNFDRKHQTLRLRAFLISDAHPIKNRQVIDRNSHLIFSSNEFRSRISRSSPRCSTIKSGPLARSWSSPL